MASLTLKNMPDELFQALREVAERDRRSLTQQIIHLLDVAIAGSEHPLRRAADVDAQVAAWRKLAGRWESDADGAIESERIMERRTGGREVDL